MTILQKLDRLPPCACRLIAKIRNGRGWRGPSHRELETISGIPKSTIAQITFRKTWRGIAIEIVDTFSAACGVDHLNVKRQTYYLRNRKLAHTESGSITQLRMYTRLWKLYAEVIKAQQS